MHSVLHVYYNSKLGSGCNLGKDLSKNKEDNQLVKCKNTGLYIYLETIRKRKGILEENNKKSIRRTWGGLYYYIRYWLINHEEDAKYSRYKSKIKPNTWDEYL